MEPKAVRAFGTQLEFGNRVCCLEAGVPRHRFVPRRQAMSKRLRSDQFPSMMIPSRDPSAFKSRLRRAYHGLSSTGIQVGRFSIDLRAACDVGMPHAWKNGPRFLPQARLNRTIH